MSRRTLAAAALALLMAAPAVAAARGPSTPEERDKAVQLVKLLESEPWTEEAKQARQWLMTFLGEAPDITVKRCLSLLGAPAQRQGIPPELLDQQLFSGARHVLEHPGTSAGSTDALGAGVVGTLAAYKAWRAHGLAAVAQLDELAKMQESGQLRPWVLAQGRNCR
jgi:hypothetical protein